MVDLTRRIRVHEGREGSDINKPRRRVHWRGTVADYWHLHPHLSLADMRDLERSLDGPGFQNIGGGFTSLAYVVRNDG